MHGPVSSLLYVERSGSLWGDFEKYKKAFLNYFKVSVTFLNVGTLLKKHAVTSKLKSLYCTSKCFRVKCFTPFRLSAPNIGCHTP